jgi:hypothetical protein
MFTAKYGRNLFNIIQVHLSLQRVKWDFYERSLFDSNLFL